MTVNPEKKLGSVVEQVLASPKYRSIHPDLVMRLAASEMARHDSLKDIGKAVRNKLHQVGGAYFPAVTQYAAWLAALRQAAGKDISPLQDPAFQSVCQRIMAGHTSTRERLPQLEDFYATIFRSLPPVSSILDAACGFNPLALPWMSLAPGVRYHAFDIYSDLVDFLNHFFTLTRMDGKVFWADALNVNIPFLDSPPGEATYDLALALKAVPCLEQIEKDAGLRLLRRLPARFLLVTYPARSLGGYQKGMPAFYAETFQALLDRAFPSGVRSVRRFDFPTELAFLVETHKNE